MKSQTKNAAATPEVAPRAATKTAVSPYVIGPVADTIFILFSPWIGLGLALTLFRVVFQGDYVDASERFLVSLDLRLVFGQMLTQAHIFLVVFRSHFNPSVFRAHRFRFTVVPVVLTIAMVISLPVFVTVRVLSQYWDIYHSSLQTFGLARIYDRRRGNDPKLGRDMDIYLAHVIYIGPLLAGINLFQALSHFLQFSDVGWDRLSALPTQMVFHTATLRAWVMGVSGLVIAVYLATYYRLYRRGYRVSPQKVILLTNTAIVSVAAWAYLPSIVALLTVNFFHAIQYFAIVLATEGSNLRERFGLRKAKLGMWITGAIVVGITFGYALVHHFWGGSSRLLTSFILTCAVMHFRWDGFIWSVRKNQV